MAVFQNNPYVAGFRDSPGVRLEGQNVGHGHLIHRLQERFGAVLTGVPRPELHLSQSERRWAEEERAKWPKERPVCVFSAQTVTESRCYRNVDWQAVGRAWLDDCTVIHPVLSAPGTYQRLVGPFYGDQLTNWMPAPEVPGTIVYRDLPLRLYFALFSAADCFFGTASGAMHLAAAFGLPSLVVVWREILERLRFPISGSRPGPEMFFYPQHAFIAAEDIKMGQADQTAVKAAVRAVLTRRRHSLGQECQYVRFLRRALPGVVMYGGRFRRIPAV